MYISSPQKPETPPNELSSSTNLYMRKKGKEDIRRLKRICIEKKRSIDIKGPGEQTESLVTQS